MNTISNFHYQQYCITIIIIITSSINLMLIIMLSSMHSRSCHIHIFKILYIDDCNIATIVMFISKIIINHHQSSSYSSATSSSYSSFALPRQVVFCSRRSSSRNISLKRVSVQSLDKSCLSMISSQYKVRKHANHHANHHYHNHNHTYHHAIITSHHYYH